MVNEAFQAWQTEDWNDIYITALLEGDPDNVPFLIHEAEHAILERARELVKASGDIFEEEEALNDALYALRGLKTCLAVHGRFVEAAGRSLIKKQ